LTERHEALIQTLEMMAADNGQTFEENKQRDRRMGS
jgi:hypothetical protein